MTDYIEPPIPTDPDELAAIFFAALQAQFPGFVPQPGQQTTIIGEGFARVAAFVANLAVAQPKAAFRFIGKLFGILPLDATSATVSSTWTVVNDSGYLIPAGTQVAIQAADGSQQTFVVASDVTIISGDTTTADGEVTLTAAVPGAASSGLGAVGTAVQLVDVLAYVDTVTLTGPTTGGVDAELDDPFLSRLATEFQLQTPRPIVPGNFAALLQNIPGISRSLALDLYQPAVNEVQQLTVNATGGTFTLSFGGHTSAAIAYNASAATVQAALELNVSIGAGGVTCSGGPLPGSPVTITFVGANAGTNEATITTGSGSLTGGTHTASVTGITNGAAALTNEPRSITVVPLDAAGQPAGSGIRTQAQAYLKALRETTFQVFVITPTYTEIDVTFQITATDGLDADVVVASATAAVTAKLDPSAWGLPSSGDRRGWIDTPTVRINDLVAVIQGVLGVQHVESVTIAAHGDSLDTANVTMPGPGALPTPGTINGSHT